MGSAQRRCESAEITNPVSAHQRAGTGRVEPAPRPLRGALAVTPFRTGTSEQRITPAAPRRRAALLPRHFSPHLSPMRDALAMTANPRDSMYRSRMRSGTMNARDLPDRLRVLAPLLVVARGVTLTSSWQSPSARYPQCGIRRDPSEENGGDVWTRRRSPCGFLGSIRRLRDRPTGRSLVAAGRLIQTATQPTVTPTGQSRRSGSRNLREQQ